MSSHDRLSVLALVAYPLGRAPGQRYRIEQWAPYLEREGIDVTFLPFASELLADSLYTRRRYWFKTRAMIGCFVRRFSDVLAARRFDVTFLHREASIIGPAWYERFAVALNPRLVYDFEDAVWLRYVSPRNRYLSYLKAPGKTATICRLARSVMTGSEHLAAYARRYSDDVAVIPSTVPLAHYAMRPEATRNDVPVIGWTGSHSSAQYLKLVEKPLQRLATRYRFRFLVIGVEDAQISGVDVTCRPWRSETEVQDLWDLDIGIMPLPDEAWTRGKCAMKAIQYFGVGIPAVVSPVGMNAEVVRHGWNGFHAVTDKDWESHLGCLLAQPSLRRKLGAAGRATVEEAYCAEVQAPRVAGILWSATK